MTLVVSLRVPDGVVIATDSLMTTKGTINIAAEIHAKCGKCGTELTLPELKLPPVQVPASTSAFGQKLFRFQDNFGIGGWGDAFVNGQTIRSQMEGLEHSLEQQVQAVDQLAKLIEQHFIGELEQQIGSWDKVPDDYFPFGFQVVGFEPAKPTEGKTWSIAIGKKPKVKCFTGFGCTVGGAKQVVLKLWKKDDKAPFPTPHYGNFSLQDAIDYAEFLIRTTADYQRFANMIPTVGGTADIALITTLASNGSNASP